VGYFIVDNINNNNTCIKELSIEFRFNLLHCRLYYMGYIINLVARMLLFGADSSALDKEEEDKDEVLQQILA